MPRRGILASLILLAGCRPDVPASPHGQPVSAPPAAATVRPFRMGRPDFVLLITGGTNGRLEVCNCAGPMPGGLARRSGLVRSYRAAFANTFLIDLGDAFWIEPNDLRNDFLLPGYRQIGYDAVVLGDQEWAAEAGRLNGLLRSTKLEYLSSTVSCPPVAAGRVVTRQWGEVKLAVVSDVRPEAFRFVPRRRVEALRFSPPEQLARRVSRLKEDGFVVVVAAHVDAENLPSAAALGADLILRGHTTRSDPKLRRVAGTPVVKVGGSETVGVVAVKTDGGRITAIEHRVELVSTSWPLDKRLLEIYQAYAHAAMRRALDADRKEGLDYVASAACGRCHRRQYAAWMAGPHSRAYRTLVRVKRTGDPNCLMCHTSGFGTKKGFHTIQRTPHLAGVNCQDCHRFNVAEHHKKGFRLPRVDEKVCTTCHTPVTDPRFDYERKAAKVRCPHAPPEVPVMAGARAAAPSPRRP